jgi:cytochrome oxidase Cu insertion factor (SCO1/SenC/PrrC family)
MMNTGLVSVLLGTLLASPWSLARAQAQPAPTPFQVQATNPQGERFRAQDLKGKVAVVFYWSTSCAVCRDSLPEMRANLNGWKNKPFALVTVNLDRRKDDWLAYENLVNVTQMPGKNLITLRQDDALPAPAKLPLTLLVDAKGNVVARYEGRVAPEVWDSVADLMN